MEEPNNNEDEFSTEEERQKAYGEACKQLGERMRDKHGDQR